MGWGVIICAAGQASSSEGGPAPQRRHVATDGDLLRAGRERRERADTARAGLAVGAEHLEDGRLVLGRDDEHHAEAAVEFRDQELRRRGLSGILSSIGPDGWVVSNEPLQSCSFW